MEVQVFRTGTTFCCGVSDLDHRFTPVVDFHTVTDCSRCVGEGGLMSTVLLSLILCQTCLFFVCTVCLFFLQFQDVSIELGCLKC